MRTGWIIQRPDTKRCWTAGAAWGSQELAKIYPSQGRAQGAVKYHRSHYFEAPMNIDVELVEVVLTETGTVVSEPFVRKPSC